MLTVPTLMELTVVSARQGTLEMGSIVQVGWILYHFSHHGQKTLCFLKTQTGVMHFR